MLAFFPTFLPPPVCAIYSKDSSECGEQREGVEKEREGGEGRRKNVTEVEE